MNSWKTILLTLSLGLTACALIAQKALPSVDVKSLDGQTINLKEYGDNGKITVLSFWATWCSPCKKELDAYANFYDEWVDTYNVEVLAITIDDQRALAKVGPMVASKGWPFEVLSDANQSLQRALNFQTIPQTFIVDQKGNIVYSHSGYVPGDEYELEDKLKELAGKG